MQGWDRARLGELVHGLLLRRLLRDRKGGERALALVDLVVELLSGERCGGEYEQACTEVRGVQTCEGVHTQRSRAAGAAGAAWTAGEVEDLVRIERASCI